jgi:hypothetical protein
VSDSNKWRKAFAQNSAAADLAITKLEVRAEKRSMDEEEVSAVIEQEALERQRRTASIPAHARGAVAFLGAVKTPYQAIVALALIALVAFLVLKGFKLI